MVKNKKQRVLKNKNDNNSNLIVNDEEMDIEPARTALKDSGQVDRSNILQDFDVQAKTWIENLETSYIKRKKALEMQHWKVMRKTPQEILELTYGDFLLLRNMATPKKIKLESLLTINENISPQPEIHKFGETFTTEKTTAANTTVTISTPFKNNEKQVILRTPIPPCHQNPKVVITKFDVSEAVNPMRWPKDNEMALSMMGSPLIVSSITRIPMINLNIPLPNGQVMAILPKPMNLLSGTVTLSAEVLQQLDCIEENIRIVKRMCQTSTPRLEYSTTRKMSLI